MQKTVKTSLMAFSFTGLLTVGGFWLDTQSQTETIDYYTPPKGCVFRTVFGEESSQNYASFKTPDNVKKSMQRGLEWIATAQQKNGGWGAGSHSRQEVRDPHAVHTDPATTSMVAMALLRSGSTLTQGPYAQQLKEALNYLLNSVETSSPNSLNITDQTGTQIQSKLGANIDVILTAQFLSNILDHLSQDASLKARVQKNLNTCITKIQKGQDQDGSIRGAGWAGVLQSSFATNALESAQKQGAPVDEKALQKAKDYQKGNLDAKSGRVNTERGAGIVLYSVTGATRSSAKEARKVRERMEQAVKKGELDQAAPATPENLEKIGFSKEESMSYSTAYEVYQAGKAQSQDKEVMSGFGNNGGEEFLSYLQTGESLIINKDNEWKKWYDNTSGRLLNIQNQDGSWNGHHCITSPVFCTATCLLILSVENDLQRLSELGK